MTDEERQLLRDLEDEFVVGCRHWYVLKLWQECGSFEASSIEDRIRVACAVLDEAGAGGTQWVWTGWIELVNHLIERLDDPVAEVRQQAAIALGDCKTRDGVRCRFFLKDFSRQRSHSMIEPAQPGPWAKSSTIRIRSCLLSSPFCKRRRIRKRLASFAVIPPRQSSGSPTTRRCFCRWLVPVFRIDFGNAGWSDLVWSSSLANEVENYCRWSNCW